MAAESERWFNYTGADDEVPDDVTHVIVSIRVIPANAFRGHPNIVEVIFDLNVQKVERLAFHACTSLRRVIMPGVKIVEEHAFLACKALTHVV